jgi:peptide deformylase
VSGMDLYDIILVPHPSLRAKAREVTKVDDTIRGQMDKMLRTMYEAPGIGLAANQVDILNRVLVMDLSRRNEEEKPTPIFMINPEVIWESDERSVMEEGCLSIPQQYAEVERPAVVRVKYLDYDGREAELQADGLLSHCVQHEIDHLNGVLFVDYLSSLKRNILLRKLDKLKKNEAL